MAESASTGNSGTTSNGGPAAPGSQTSSNGSFSTGNGNNGGSNSGVGPGLSFGAGVGAVNGPSIGLPSFNNGKANFTGFASSNFGQGWGGAPTHTVSPGADGKHTIHPDANGKHTVYATTKSDRSGSTIKQLTVPVMTVDEVYGKGNQSITESGDYEASSNEKSNVETSTFGKQDEISVTPVSVTEDKGLVNNDAIQSVEGLDFQQKDKANQEVMEAKKSRDEAEAEDNADGMRDQLKAVAEKDAEETETDTFQVGEKNTFEEENNTKLNELNNLKQKVEAANKKVAQYEPEKTKEMLDKFEEKQRADIQKAEETKQAISDFIETFIGLAENPVKTFLNKSEINEMKSRAIEDAKAYGLDLDPNGRAKDIVMQYTDAVRAKCDKDIESANKLIEGRAAAEANLQKAYDDAVRNQQEAQANYDKAQEDYKTWEAEYWTAAEKSKAEEEAAAKKAEEAPTTEAPAYKAKIETARNEINNSKDLSDEQKAETNTVLDNIESAADAMNKAANDLATNPNDINAAQRYVEETSRYLKALKDAKGNKVLKNTDHNKTFTKAVADANDFKVTREDGTQQDYAEFAAEIATKSPKIAKGLYEAKAKNYEEQAKNYEENGHKVLAAMKTAKSKIETAKSKMVMTWLGSKFTFADNQVRNQFIQMAKTDMRATYATHNNVLNDETGKYSEAEKAEAFDAIKQANSLMTASAALQASTGFFNGIDDSPSDGVYGVTDPVKLKGYQKALNAASNFAKITLGLGVTPGANEAYQNMYYLAGDKAKNSILFGRDFDGDGFALCQEYGNNAAVGMIAGAGELAVAVALMFNPATSKMGIKLAIDSVKTFFDGLYGVQKEVNKSIKYSNEVLNYFNEAKSIAAETGNNEATSTMDSAIKQIEDFQLKSDEVGNLDNWLEGSGSNTADNGKFNQALSYDEWLKLIEADPVMQEYAKSLNR